MRNLVSDTYGVVGVRFLLLISMLAMTVGQAAGQGRQPIRIPKPGQVTPSIEELREFEDVVELEVLSDVAAVKAGESFRVGVVFEIRRDWRIFWQYPSERLPMDRPIVGTTLGVEAPVGFEVGEVKYPVPLAMGTAGGFREFVYQGEAMLLVEITVPEDFGELTGEAEFEMRARWTIQKEGDGQVYSYARTITLALPIAGNDFESSEEDVKRAGVNAERIAGYEALVPRPLTEAKDIEVRWEHELLKDVIVFSFGDADHVDFFPIPARYASCKYEKQVVGPDPKSDGVLLEVYYGYETRQLASRSAVANGVLVEQRGDEVAYYLVDVPKSFSRQRFKRP